MDRRDPHARLRPASANTCPTPGLPTERPAEAPAWITCLDHRRARRPATPHHLVHTSLIHSHLRHFMSTSRTEARLRGGGESTGHGKDRTTCAVPSIVLGARSRLPYFPLVQVLR